MVSRWFAGSSWIKPWTSSSLDYLADYYSIRIVVLRQNKTLILRIKLFWYLNVDEKSYQISREKFEPEPGLEPLDL